MFDCVFKRIPDSADNADKDSNSLFHKILPITRCESGFCGRNRDLADGKYFDSKILAKEIKKIDRSIPFDFAYLANAFGSRSWPLAESIASRYRTRYRHAPRFDTAERLT